MALLADRYIAPPFSVLDSRMGYWRDHKRYWREIIKCDEVRGRDNYVLAGNDKTRTEYAGRLSGFKSIVVEVSKFDPVLAEICCKWFCPLGGEILDPFCGGSVRGLVAELSGYKYTGVDLRREQITANIQDARLMECSPTYICDDSLYIDCYFANETFDFVFSCPPYFDLEHYSDDPRDLSNMTYNDFMTAYHRIIIDTCRKLKQDRFACFVVGDIRDKQGFYRGFVDDTKRAFSDAGLRLYNELIFIEEGGTAAIRAGKTFDSGRKCVKTHQNVLIYYKGDARQIKSNFGKFNRADF